MNIQSIFNLGLLFFSILSLGAMSGYFSERAGIVNIGINGTMTFGALFYCIFAGLINGGKFGSLGNESFLLPMLLAMICSPIIGLLFGYATIKLKANHIIAGTGINILGASLGMFLTNPLGTAIMGTEELRNPYIGYMPIGGTASSFYGTTLIIFFLVVVLIVTLYLIMKYTKFGLRMISIGENPNAADSQGINVYNFQWKGLIISSCLAGLAGAIFMYRSPNVSFIGDVDGLGFLALAIMITGAWRIPLISVASFVFAILLGISRQSIPSVSNDLLLIIPYAFSLVALILFSKKIKGPKNAGNNFDKTKR
ncbi:MAG: ABC transporter permease [Malacoplasma sp.]